MEDTYVDSTHRDRLVDDYNAYHFYPIFISLTRGLNNKKKTDSIPIYHASFILFDFRSHCFKSILFKKYVKK